MMKPISISPKFVLALPKTDLHVHLDGSLRLPTLIALAKDHRVTLPSYSEAGLRELVFREHYQGLQAYLQGFVYTTAVMQTAEALSQIAYELAEDCQNENVFYVEVRFAPQLHVRPEMDIVGVLKAVDAGLKLAQTRFNHSEVVKTRQKPPFHYGIVCCAMRKFSANFSYYYQHFLAAHPYSQPKEVFKMASMQLCHAAVLARDAHGLPVVGFDLAGEEAGYPASDHQEAFALAHTKFLKKTVHAGEAYGPESIFQAITALHAERIGHGTYLLAPEMIHDTSIADKQAYVAQLGEYIADQRITLEICLSSNLQTNPHMQSVQQHSFRQLREHCISTAICTDNRLVSNTTVTKELLLAIDALQTTDLQELKSIVIYGFKRSFFAGSYIAKRKFVQEIINYYDQVEAQFGYATSSLERQASYLRLDTE